LKEVLSVVEIQMSLIRCRKRTICFMSTRCMKGKKMAQQTLDLDSLRGQKFCTRIRRAVFVAIKQRKGLKKE
jgi:hypothetical protein